MDLIDWLSNNALTVAIAIFALGFIVKLWVPYWTYDAALRDTERAQADARRAEDEADRWRAVAVGHKLVGYALLDKVDAESGVQAVYPRDYLAALKHKIVRHMSAEDFRDLCYDLNIDYESLGGSEKSSKVRSLMEKVERESRVNDLLAKLRAAYPYVLQAELQ